MFLLSPFLLLCVASSVLSGVSQCGAPGSPVGGSVDLPGLTGDSLYSPGTVARYQCDEGRVRSGGQEARQCQQDGTWAGHPPTCRESLSYNRSTLQSQPASQQGSQMAVDGDPESCATSSGASRWWQVKIEERPVTAIGLVLPLNTLQQLSIFVIQLLEGDQAMYKPCSALDSLTVSRYVLFSCDKGRGLLGEFIYIRDDRPEEESVLTLCEVDVFSGDEDLQCGPPDSPAGGSVRTFEGAAQYQCDEGRRLTQGNSTRLCIRGAWDGRQPLCQELECPSPLAPPDGYIKILNFTGSYQPGSLASYACNSGYRLTGAELRRCGSDGHWAGESPSCLPVSCGDPPSHNRSSVVLVNTTNTLHSLAIYHCHPPHSVNQSEAVMVSRCMEDGHWTPVEVQCSLPSVASTWSIVTISVLAVVILLLLSALLWLFGHERLGKMIQKKPSLTSQGVSTKTLEISHLQSPFNSPLTNTLPSFYKTCGPRQPLADPATTSERSSGDGEESLYATIRRKKSFQSCHLQGEAEAGKSPPFIPELKDKFESEVTNIQPGLIKPSQIKQFVNSQSK